MERATDYSKIPLVMDAKDLQNLGFSRSMVYNILNQSDFPVIVIGGRKLVHRDRFFEWLDQQTEAVR